MDSWSISVKTVGGKGLTSTAATAADGTENKVLKPSPTNFTVHVAPNDTLVTLHKQIESITGLKASQQRLIYRGKLISSGTEVDTSSNMENYEGGEHCLISKTRVCDIDGLSDGQTIHLVPRPMMDLQSNSNRANATTVENSSSDNFDPGSSITGDVGAGLLSALLGLGTSGMIPVQAGEVNLSDLGSLRQSRTGTRAARSVARRRRVNAHRRVATDPRYPQLAPLEPVRQGLLTLHTMIESQRGLDESPCLHPLEIPRRFYRGQWIDARDTVNQWCEATIVEVLSPEEILKIPKSSCSMNMTATNAKRRVIVPPSDSAVAANDLEGRRRLLLEPCENMVDSNNLAKISGDQSLNGFRERSSNTNVQLLLIHYNGWPHRWDEWIRSDSERIRPFRTRSKNSVLQSSHCPVPQNSFDSAPSTFIVNEDDASDRPYVIPELQRALMMVSDLFESATDHNNNEIVRGVELVPSSVDEQSGLVHSIDSSTEKNRPMATPGVCEKRLPWLNCSRPLDQKNNDLDEGEKIDDSSVFNETPPTLPRYNKRKLELLAPLLDRLGRVLLDTAPHIAALAEALPESDKEDALISEMNAPTLGNDISSASSRTPLLSGTDEDDPESLISADMNETTDIVDPDHLDFVNGFVNYLNSDGVPSANIRRNLRSISSTGTGSSLFNAPDDENATPGARFIRLGGGNAAGPNGGGIDIHIHAIVTGTGINAIGGGLPFMSGVSNLMNESSSTRTNPISAVNRSLFENPTVQDEDDLGLFSDLYSDAPPIATSTHDISENNGSSDQGETDNGSNMDNSNSNPDEPLYDSSNPGGSAQVVESDSLSGRQPVNSAGTQTTTSLTNGVERPSPRSSLALVFRRALGRSNR